MHLRSEDCQRIHGPFDILMVQFLGRDAKNGHTVGTLPWDASACSVGYTISMVFFSWKVTMHVPSLQREEEQGRDKESGGSVISDSRRLAWGTTNSSCSW